MLRPDFGDGRRIWSPHLMAEYHIWYRFLVVFVMFRVVPKRQMGALGTSDLLVVVLGAESVGKVWQVSAARLFMGSFLS